MCGRAPEDGGHEACIEVYAQSMQSADEAPIPPARIEMACEPAAAALIVTDEHADVTYDSLAPPVHLKTPFKVPI